jgi:hypothetical protein
MKKWFPLFLCLWVGLLPAQSIFFENTIGGPSQDIGRSAIQTSDNQYAAVGYTSSFGAGNSDVWLVKVLPTGFPRWTKTFGGPGVDLGLCLRETKPDQGLIIAGYTDSYGAGGYDCYLIKTDSTGTAQWSKTYGGADWDMAYSVSLTSDGGYILTGGTYSYGAGDEDVYLIKINANGDTLWTKTFGGKKQDEGRSVKQTMDGGYIIVGTTKSFRDTVNGDAYIIRTDPNGNMLWQKSYGGTFTDDAHDIIEFADSTLYFVGGSYSYCQGSPGSNEDVITGKLASTGDSLHILNWGGSADDRAESIIELTPTRCIVLCNSKSYGYANNTFDFWAFYSDQYGDWITGNTFGDASKPSDEVGYSICRTNDNGYLMCGYSTGFNTNGIPDFFLVKVDSLLSNPPIIAGIESFSVSHINVSPIYPDPVTDQAFLDISSPDKTGPVKIRLFDGSGRDLTEELQMEQMEVNGGTKLKLRFNKAGLEPGMYFYELRIGGQSGSGRFILH